MSNERYSECDGGREEGKTRWKRWASPRGLGALFRRSLKAAPDCSASSRLSITPVSSFSIGRETEREKKRESDAAFLFHFAFMSLSESYHSKARWFNKLDHEHYIRAWSPAIWEADKPLTASYITHKPFARNKSNTFRDFLGPLIKNIKKKEKKRNGFRVEVVNLKPLAFLQLVPPEKRAAQTDATELGAESATLGLSLQLNHHWLQHIPPNTHTHTLYRGRTKEKETENKSDRKVFTRFFKKCLRWNRGKACVCSPDSATSQIKPLV